MKHVVSLLLLLPTFLSSAPAHGQSRYDYANLKMEQLDRGLVAVRASSDSVLLSWRYLREDALTTEFDIYRDGKLVGHRSATESTTFMDYNPGGKLPVTFYRSNSDLPDFLDYSMKNRTYRYFTGVPQYAFGYGLSYSTFDVGKGKLSVKSMKKDGKVTVTAPVTNTGKCAGTETVQVYVKALDDAGAPIKALKGFQKLYLQPGETKNASITLDGEAFEYYDEMIDELSVKSGRYQILYGTSSLDKDLKSIEFVVK